MKAIIQSYKTGELNVMETPPPQLRPGWVLVQNSFSLISAGTEKTKVDTAKKSLIGKAMARPDLVKKVLAKAKREGLWKAWQTASDRLEQPNAMGYSCAGQILEVSGDVDGLLPGEWVACGGGTANHAEIVAVPKNLVVPIPEGVSTDHAASATLGAIAMQGVRQAEVRLGEKVAVIGLGLMGLLTVQLLKSSGCRVLGIDVDPAKVAIAKELGCDIALLAGDEGLEEQVLLFTGGYGVDATIITAGTMSNRPVEQAGDITREKGKVVVVGLAKMDIPREPYYMKEIDVRLSRSYGPGRYDLRYEEDGQDYPIGYVRFTERRNMASFLELLQSGDVQLGKMITHRFPIDQATAAYGLISGERKENYLAILLEYQRPMAEIPRRIDYVSTPLGGNRIKVGVIGAGNYATKHLLPEIKSSSVLEPGSVCTSSGVTASHVAKKFGFRSAEADADAVIAKSDAIVIATRHNDHAGFAVKALLQGKPVFVEKPLVISDEQLDDVLAAVGKSPNASIMVGFNRRFAPATALIQQHFSSVRGAKHIFIRVNAGSIPKDHWIHNPNVGGGRLLGEGCHFVDLAVALGGACVRTVQALGIPQPERTHALWEDFSIQLSLTNGSLATIVYTAIGDSGLPKERVEVSAGGKSAVIDDFTSLELWDEGKKTRKTWAGQDKGQQQQMVAWTRGLKEGKSPIPLDQVINVHRACLAAVESIRNGKPVVLPKASL